MTCTTQDAFNLMLQGSLALARVEAAGMKVDEGRLAAALQGTADQAKELDAALRADPIWKRWAQKFPGRAVMGNRQQLGAVIFDDLGYERLMYEEDRSTREVKEKNSEAAFAHVDLPFVSNYFKWAKQVSLHARLQNLQRNLVGGRLHPNFNLHTVSTFRSSSGKDREDEKADSVGGDFNIQNVPARLPGVSEVIRGCFVPEDEDWVLLELDYGRIEVHGNYHVSHDPVLGKYLDDADSDMHRDMGMQLFFLNKDQAAEKNIRYTTKNQYVFATFYGDWYRSTAAAMWKSLERKQLKVKGTDKTVLQHLAEHGITQLGPCDGRVPLPNTFEYHVRAVEHDFWHNRFAAHNRWREEWYRGYLKRSYITTNTGFTVGGVLRKNQVFSIPVQGPCFHYLLQSLIWIVDWLHKHKMRSKVIAQVHDSINLSVHRDELQDVIEACLYFMLIKLPRHWPFIISRLEAEVEVAEDSWWSKEQWVKEGGTWLPKRKAG